ncbi:monovalent cation/H+ antiporter complex subunit F [Chitinivibrio alkaliphilus]|uniref:Putative monovalent cation/H+ antiporter subunit F n=1 Tax=Chitinivibrio alkaliphilus ACht1 TaxID=1313304 RepID=U7D775_9BACT|nr:monovalent cation/H+ antiporter complex subunit F [Chitinivibrio alkaliphilus]ERP30942.1 putative monovalent cation/H+ antiporter subunit F [Chitinivibrio alkaliphilus ACht1]
MTWLLYSLMGLLIFSSVRLFIGPEFQDRLLAASVVQSILTVLFCILAITHDITYYLDIALLLALLSFASVIAFSRLLLRDRSFFDQLAEEPVNEETPRE